MSEYNVVIDDLVKMECLIRLHFYDGIGVVDTIWTGKIVFSGLDKKTGEGFISFCHIPSEAKRLQCDRSYLFIPDTKILSIDVLSKDFDRFASFNCPHCGAAVALEETIIAPESDIIKEEEGTEKECLDFKDPAIV